MRQALTGHALNTSAHRWLRRLAWAAAGVAALAGVSAVLVVVCLPSNEALAQRAARELTKAAGYPVQVGGLRWQLLPKPFVVLTDVVADAASAETDGPVKAQPAITLQRITLVPEVSWAALRSRQLRLQRAAIDGAVVHQRALVALSGVEQKSRPSSTDAANTSALDQLIWERVTWVSRYDIPVVLTGKATFDSAWRPRTITVQLPDAKVRADLTLTRQGMHDRWAVHGHLGGGTASGDVLLQTNDTAWTVGGRLALQGIGVADALQAVNRRPVVSGLASGSTVLSARSTFAEGPAQLVKSLRTDTRFTMGRSLLLGFDMDKAIRTAGGDTRGQTALDSITGTVSTQNTGNGMVIDFSNIKAASGALSATGRARLADRHVEAEVSVDLVDGLLGVPLRITGPVNAVKVSVAPGTLAGAAVGTAVLPGVGTALGARLGAALGKLFGNEPTAAGKSGTRKP